MAKTLQNLIATAIIAGTLCSPAYSSERLNRRYENVAQGSAQKVVESAAEGMGKGLEMGLGGLKSISPVANFFGSSNSYEDKEKRIELKRKTESYAFRYILENIQKNPSEEGNLLKSIVEDTKKYHDSLTIEQKRKFNDFWEKVDRKNLRNILVYSNKNAFAWRLMKSELDLAEMHILYQLETRNNAKIKEKDNPNKEVYKKHGEAYYSFKRLLRPEGINEYISKKTGHNQLRAPSPAQKMP